MNPNYAALMNEAAKRNKEKKAAQDSDQSGDHRVRKTKYLKSEVNFEHPAKGKDHCRDCSHFQAPQACKIVAGHIRPGDWCQRFDKKE